MSNLSTVSPVAKTKAKILFVDDEERIVRLLRIMFHPTYTVFTATSPAEALNIIKTNSLDVVVSDQRMPGMTGVELLSEVRKLSPNTIRVLLTGYSDLVAIIGAVNEGEIYRFISKPWQQDELRVTLAECVARASEQEDLSLKRINHSGASATLSAAAKLLYLDGLPNDQHEVVEMFTKDFDVITATTISEALDVLEMHEVGVIVTNAIVNGESTTQLLASLKKHAPSIITVVLSNTADSNTVIDFINRAQIYRFAMKPIQPNLFRLAVHAAMREHHRIRADTKLLESKPKTPESMPENTDVIDRILKSLSRFTQVWKSNTN